MILGLFRGRDRNLAIVDGLYAAVAEAIILAHQVSEQ